MNCSMPTSLGQKFTVLVVSDLDVDSAVGAGVHAIETELEALGRPVSTAHSLDDAEALVASNSALACVVLSWTLASADSAALTQTLRILTRVRGHAERLPVLLGASRSAIGNVPIEIVEQIEGYIWALEDSPAFIAGRIDAAARRYLDSVLPPFFGAMTNFADVHEYSWHTPGHTGGTAFMKTAVGRAFLGFYGEQMLRSDLSISVEDLGSLNDHSGPVGEAERYAARVFGADQTYFSIGGSSASNEIVLHSAAADGDIVLVDRNCHKSLNYALKLSGAIPVYLKPTRNARGVIGPVPASELEPETIRKKLEDSPLVADPSQQPVLAVLTNSTYDGLCYDVECTTALLSQSVPRIHYDEAWFAYARFNPIYEGRYGMHRGVRSDDDATVSVTHSTHKLLAALSQASMIHVRSGRVPVEPTLFNEAFMTHTSTSPQYSIIASTDVSAKMMDDAGPALTDESIREAIDFRQEILRIGRELRNRDADDWWFDTWQVDELDGRSFLDAKPDDLATAPEAWLLGPKASWHGFGDLSDRYCMLDPIKVTTLTPGVGPDGRLLDRGIPAAIVSRFLGGRGIVVEKTEPYSILTLFSIGTTKGKWGSLVAGLFEFKELYDANAPLSTALPELIAAHPQRYGGMGLCDLAGEMHDAIREHGILGSLDAAFETLPEPVLTPRDAYARLVHGEVEPVPAAQLEGRILAVQVVPYPPGIPLLMPGERFGAETRAVGDFLLGLESFDAQFPGFEHDTHGVEVKNDESGRPYYVLYCVEA
ncbi:MAG: arginine decarboxylase [bacterium]|jgi:arginine/lysine/ornithine decarboxylase|nr:arginine decarboxylase [Deltaproteobacteria bacterium]MCP4243008.1 arginine decarboxylase [bacterium]